MPLPYFVGRKHELALLHNLRKKKRPNLVVVKGRRRVGKSRLIAHFASTITPHIFWSFAGLAPHAGTDEQSQRDHFAQQLASYLKVPPFTFHDWTDAFSYLGSHLKAGDIILFDEISWMGSHDHHFIPKLKAWWDKQTTPCILVLCGSVSPWIDENILNSTALFGRINLTLTLEPLSIPESAQLLKLSGFQGSDYDTFKLLSILGGVPWYLEQVTPGKTADEIIKHLCFEKNGLLVLEFDRIFHDLFDNKGTTYKKILNVLKEGMKTLAEIRTAIDFPRSGTLTMLMEQLITAGFIQKHALWSFKTTKNLKQSLYRISDPYLRFYLKLIEPQRAKIDTGTLHTAHISQLPGFDAHLGLQLEQLLLQNRPLLLKAMGIYAGDIIADGPFRQTTTASQTGCQIDYLVQTATNNLFIAEFKYKRRDLGVEAIAQVQDTIKALKIPRGFAPIPVLFHLGGISTAIATGDFFYRIIDITDFIHDKQYELE